MRHLEDYRKLHDANAFGGLTLARFAPIVLTLLRRHRAESVLDYGCARGQSWERDERLAKYRAEHEVALYDPAVVGLDQPPAGQFDAVLAIDVLEHVPEDEVDEVLTRIFGYAKRVVILSFCPRGSKKKLPSTGEDVHVTQRDRLWWERRIHHANSHLARPRIWYLFANP
jgi:hypothetical protein